MMKEKWMKSESRREISSRLDEKSVLIFFAKIIPFDKGRIGYVLIAL